MADKGEKPVLWADNEQARIVLSRLKQGPQSTIELQTAPIVHVARQIWELRHWYGWKIVTGRLPNRVAVYRLLGQEAAMPLELVGGKVPAPIPPSRSPLTFGDPDSIRQARIR